MCVRYIMGIHQPAVIMLGVRHGTHQLLWRTNQRFGAPTVRAESQMRPLGPASCRSAGRLACAAISWWPSCSPKKLRNLGNTTAGAHPSWESKIPSEPQAGNPLDYILQVQHDAFVNIKMPLFSPRCQDHIKALGSCLFGTLQVAGFASESAQSPKSSWL